MGAVTWWLQCHGSSYLVATMSWELLPGGYNVMGAVTWWHWGWPTSLLPPSSSTRRQSWDSGSTACPAQSAATMHKHVNHGPWVSCNGETFYNLLTGLFSYIFSEVQMHNHHCKQACHATLTVCHVHVLVLTWWHSVKEITQWWTLVDLAMRLNCSLRISI